jgi:hypothetical protein
MQRSYGSLPCRCCSTIAPAGHGAGRSAPTLGPIGLCLARRPAATRVLVELTSPKGHGQCIAWGRPAVVGGVGQRCMAAPSWSPVSMLLCSRVWSLVPGSLPLDVVW